MHTAWKTKVARVWPYATTATTVMFSSTALVGFFIAWQAGASRGFDYVIAVVDTAIAALAMLLVCVVAPDVFVGRPFRAPHVLTLPVLYLVLVFGVKTVSQTASSALKRLDGAGRFDLMWLQPGVLFTAWIVAVVAMSSVGAFSKESQDVK